MFARNIKPRERAYRGLTLIEILIVLGIMGLLVGMMVINFEKIFGGAEEKVAQNFVDMSLGPSLLKYRIDTGSYPTTEEGLKALLELPATKAAKWKGPYIEKLPQDPWGNLYQYRFPGTKNADKYDLFSYGPDGVESVDDIGNWD